MNRAVAVLRLVRIGNGVIAAIGVLVAARWANYYVYVASVVAALAALCLAAVANAANDLADVDIDRVAHPDRPLVTGALTPSAARAIVTVAAIGGIALSYFAAPPLALVSVAVIALMLAYNRGLKQRGLPGNVTVAVLASLPFLYGAWSVGAPMRALPLLAIAIPLHFARELAKDVDDAPGDAAHRATLPVARGPQLARWTSALAAAIFCVALVRVLGRDVQPLLVLVPPIALTVIAAERLVRGRRGAPGIYKAAMVCAMLALLAA